MIENPVKGMEVYFWCQQGWRGLPMKIIKARITSGPTTTGYYFVDLYRGTSCFRPEEMMSEIEALAAILLGEGVYDDS